MGLDDGVFVFQYFTDDFLSVTVWVHGFHSVLICILSIGTVFDILPSY